MLLNQRLTFDFPDANAFKDAFIQAQKENEELFKAAAEESKDEEKKEEEKAE